MQEENENDLPKVAFLRLTRSKRKRLESIDSDASERSNTPNVFDLETKNEKASSNEEGNKLDATIAGIKKSTTAQSEIKSTEIMNSPVRRRSRRANSVTLEENMNIQEENTKTPVKQAALAIAGRRTTRRSSILLGEAIEFSPSIASPSRRGRRRSINQSEDGAESKANNPILSRKMTLLDTCVPEEEDLNQIQCLENSSRSDNSKSPNNELTEAYEEDKLCPALCTRSRSKSPRELISQQKVSTNDKKDEKIQNKKDDVEIENGRDKNVDKELTNIDNLIENITENSPNKSTAETSQNMCQDNNSKNLNKSIILENEPFEEVYEEDFIQLRVNEDDKGKDNLKAVLNANMINDQENEKNVKNSIEIGTNNSKLTNIDNLIENITENSPNKSTAETSQNMCQDNNSKNLNKSIILENEPFDEVYEEDFIQLRVNEDDKEKDNLKAVLNANMINDQENEKNVKNSIEIGTNNSKRLSLNMNKSKMNYSEEETRKIVDEEMEEPGDLHKSNSNDIDDIEKSKNINTTASVLKNISNDNSINTESNNLVISSQKEIGKDVTITNLNETDEKNNSIKNNDTPSKECTDLNNSKNKNTLLDKSKNLDDKKDKENLSMNTVTISSNLISKCGTENALTPFRKLMSTELTASSTPITTAEKSINENNSRNNTAKIMDENNDNEDGSLNKKNLSKKHQSVVIKPTEINDKSSKFPKTPIPSKSRSHISDFNFDEANDDNLVEISNDSISNSKSNKPEKISLRNDMSCVRGTLNLSDDSENTSLKKLPGDKSKDKSTIFKSNFATSWDQSVKGTGDKTIDAFGLKKNDTIEKNEKKQDEKNESFTVGNTSRNISNSEDSDDEIEDEEEAEEEKNEFIDDEVEEVETSYDSMDSEEREYLKNNEIPDDGISIGSKDTIENCDNCNDDGSDDEMGSFIASDNEEQQRSSGESSIDKYECKSDISDIDENIKEKFNKNKMKIISSDESNDSEKEEKSSENMDISKKIKLQILDEVEDSQQKSENDKSKSVVEVNQLEENIPKTTDNEKDKEKESNDEKVDVLDENEANPDDPEKTDVTTESENNLSKESMELQKINEKEEKERSMNVKNSSNSDSDLDTCELNHNKKSVSITCGRNKKDLFEYKDKTSLKKSERHSLPLARGKHDKTLHRDTKSMEREIIYEMKEKSINIMDVKEADVEVKGSFQQSKETIKKDFKDNNTTNKSTNSLLLNDSQNTSENESESSSEFFKNFLQYSYDKNDSNDSLEKNGKNDLESDVNKQKEINQSSIFKKSTKQLPSKKTTFEKVTTETKNKKKDTISNKSFEKERNVITMSDEERIMKKCNEMLEVEFEAKKKEKMLNKKPKEKKMNKNKKNKMDQKDDSVDNIVETEKENQIESRTKCHDKEVEKALKFSVKLIKEEIEKCITHPKGLKIQQSLPSKRLSKDNVIDGIKESQKGDDVDDEVIPKSIKKDTDSTKHLKRKFFDEWSSSSEEAEYSEKPKNIKKKYKKLTGIIKNSSGLFFEESITPKKIKNNKVKLLKFPWGVVREEEITSDAKITVSGFKETAVTPIKSGKRKLKKMKDNDNNKTSKIIQYPWGEVKEEIIKETNIIPPRSVSHKIKTVLVDGKIEIPKIEKKNKKSKKRKIRDPVNVLPKPRWIRTWEEEKRKHKENSGSESEIYDGKIVKKIRLDDTASTSTNTNTQVFVKSLNEKKQKKTALTGINSSAFEFKKKALSSDRIPRETTKQLLQRKEKQRINAIFK